MANYQRSITFQLNPPPQPFTVGGFYLNIMPVFTTQQQAMLDGSGLLDGSGSVGGVTPPMTFGPFSVLDFPNGVTVMIPEPTVHPLTYQYVVQSYNATGTVNAVDGSPTGTFTLNHPVTKPASGVAYTRNVTGLVPQVAVNKSSGGLSAGTGTLYTFIPVSWVVPVNDPTYQATIFIIEDSAGNVFWESGPMLGTSGTLAFPTPSAVGVYTVYACGFDGTNVNPVVPGITPSFTVTIGTNGGVVDPTQVPVGSGISNIGPLTVKYGFGLTDDGGFAAVSIDPASPFANVAGQLGFLAGDGLSVVPVLGVPTLQANVDGTTLTFSAGVLEVGGVPLSKLGGTGTMPMGWTYAGNVAINQLVVTGNAYFSPGVALFAYDATHPFVEIGSAGLILGDNFTTPVNTMAISPSGMSLQYYNSAIASWSAGTYTYGNTVSHGTPPSNYICVVASTTTTPGSSTDWSLINVVSVTSAGVGIYGPTCSFTATSFGILMTSGSTGASVAISPSGGVLVQDASGMHYVQINSSGVTIVGGILTAPTINGGIINITTSGSYGTATLSSTSTGIQFASGTFTSNYSAFDLNINNSATGGGFQIGGASAGYVLSLTNGGGAQASLGYDATNHRYSALVKDNSGVTSILTTFNLSISGNQVVGIRRTGPGLPTGFADSAAQAWCNSLYLALAVNGGNGHGLIN